MLFVRFRNFCFIVLSTIYWHLHLLEWHFQCLAFTYNHLFVLIPKQISNYFRHHCSVTFNIGANGNKAAQTAWQAFPCSSDICFFHQLTTERCMASGCLQAVITPLLLLTQPRFSGQAQTLNGKVFCIKTGNHCRCSSLVYSYFMNVWTLITSPVCTLTLIAFSSPIHHHHQLYRHICITVSVPVRESFWNVLPWLWFCSTQSTNANQKWKAIRWEIFTIALHIARAVMVQSHRWYTAPYMHTRELSTYHIQRVIIASTILNEWIRCISTLLTTTITFLRLDNSVVTYGSEGIWYYQ